MKTNSISLQQLTARQPAKFTQRLQQAVVGIAGVGGLGSLVAQQLSRAGVGHLVLVDSDTVDSSNLNRQYYSMNQIGLPKAEQMAANISAFTSHVKVTAYQQWLTSANCKQFFSECDLVIECLDSAEAKADLLVGLRSSMPKTPCIAASGVAGLGDPSDIQVRRVSEYFHVVGDMHSEEKDQCGLFACKVGAVASIQAWLALRILLGESL